MDAYLVHLLICEESIWSADFVVGPTGVACHEDVLFAVLCLEAVEHWPASSDEMVCRFHCQAFAEVWATAHDVNKTHLLLAGCFPCR
jgi:hypothetical protein